MVIFLRYQKLSKDEASSQIPSVGEELLWSEEYLALVKRPDEM